MRVRDAPTATGIGNARYRLYVGPGELKNVELVSESSQLVKNRQEQAVHIRDIWTIPGNEQYFFSDAQPVVQEGP